MTKVKYIYFAESTFGNDAGDIAEIEEENEIEVYYTDGYGRWCYMPKPGRKNGWRYAKPAEIAEYFESEAEE